MGLSHGLNQFVDYELASSQWALTGGSVVSDDFVVSNFTASVSSLASDLVSKCFFCQDSQGWGPVSRNQFSLTPCFIDGVVLNFPNLLLLTLGSYQIHNLLKQKPLPTRWDWKFVSKLVSINSAERSNGSGRSPAAGGRIANV